MASFHMISEPSSKYDAFLHFSLWEDKNGMPLSLLSALARLDVDPWQEAEALSQLPKESAFQELVALLERLPGRPPLRPDLDAICEYSASLLPRPPPQPAKGGVTSITPRARVYSMITTSVVFGVVYFVTFSLMLAHQPSTIHSSAPASSSSHGANGGQIAGTGGR